MEASVHKWAFLGLLMLVSATLSAQPGHQAPVADAGPDLTVPAGSGNTTLQAVNSKDDRVTSSYLWRLGDLIIAEGDTVTTTLSPGIHTLDLMVTDTEGRTATDQVTITVLDNEPPVAVLDVVSVAAVGDGNVVVSVGDSSDPEKGLPYMFEFYVNAALVRKLSPEEGHEVRLTLPSGAHEIRMIAVDEFGARSEAVADVDVPAP